MNLQLLCKNLNLKIKLKKSMKFTQNLKNEIRFQRNFLLLLKISHKTAKFST